MAEVTLFVGPSGHGVERGVLEAGDVTVRPPVRRGDIDQLIDGAGKPGVVVVCDGVLQAVPAVSHAELGRAIERGWQLWGVSSIGAIRAFEMRAHGMHGFGYVYSLFGRLEDFTDDEMCLLHLPEAPWLPATEPLVNLRYALERHGPELGIGEAAQHRVLDALGRLWFGERTDAAMRSALLLEGGVAPGTADALLRWMQAHRVKTLDLIELMTARPWQAPRAPAARSPTRRQRASARRRP